MIHTESKWNFFFVFVFHFPNQSTVTYAMPIQCHVLLISFSFLLLAFFDLIPLSQNNAHIDYVFHKKIKRYNGGNETIDKIFGLLISHSFVLFYDKIQSQSHIK